MQANFDLLKAKASAIDSKMNTQISCTRTRAVLLEVKKLCDQLRKDCLEHSKATKKSKKVKVSVPEPESEPTPTIMNDVHDQPEAPEAPTMLNIIPKLSVLVEHTTPTPKKPRAPRKKSPAKD